MQAKQQIEAEQPSREAITGLFELKQHNHPLRTNRKHYHAPSLINLTVCDTNNIHIVSEDGINDLLSN